MMREKLICSSKLLTSFGMLSHAMLRCPTLCFVQGERRFYLGAVSDDLFLATVSDSLFFF